MSQALALSIGLILGGELAVLQAPIWDSLSFDRFTLLNGGLALPKWASVHLDLSVYGWLATLSKLCCNEVLAGSSIVSFAMCTVNHFLAPLA